MNTTSIIIITAIILIAILLIVFIVWQIQSRHFRPSADKQKQQMDLNADLEETGFAYERKGDYFYSLMNCWQREAGYCHLYDEAAPLFNMIMDCEPVVFSYAGKRWLIELWKGQYGITTGGEIGIYNTDREDLDTDKFKGTFYEAIRNDERLNMSFVLRKNGKVILRRKALHWWLTGFKLGEFSQTDSLTMDAKITFRDRGMKNAFVDGLRQLGYQKKEFSVGSKTVRIHYTTPHSPQTESRNKVRETLVQQTNNSNCKLYEFSTGKYSDTLDKVEYIKAMVPELYTIFIKSLYARGIYEAFGWIKEWLEGHHPKPIPKPPIPPERPCPPEPPCCPRRPCPPEPLCCPERLCSSEPSCCPKRPCPSEPSCCPKQPCPPEPSCCPERPCPPEPSCCPERSCPSEALCHPEQSCPSEPPCRPEPSCHLYSSPTCPIKSPDPCRSFDRYQREMEGNQDEIPPSPFQSDFYKNNEEYENYSFYEFEEDNGPYSFDDAKEEAYSPEQSFFDENRR